MHKLYIFSKKQEFQRKSVKNAITQEVQYAATWFVGGIAGYFRNTKSSSLNVIKRLRILSVSWCDSSAWKRSFLNRLRISLQAERYSVPERAECAL